VHRDRDLLDDRAERAAARRLVDFLVDGLLD
jgi:hypothetical protein